MDSSFPSSRRVGDSHENPNIPPSPPKSSKNDPQRQIDPSGYDISKVAHPLSRNPTKVIPRTAIPKSHSKNPSGISPKDQSSMISQVVSRASRLMMRRKTPRSPDSISGPEPIYTPIEGNLPPVNTPHKDMPSLKRIISFRTRPK